MARSEARLAVSIWSDPDFLALRPGAQRMFMFLLSQPDLAHDGVIALRERRWSKAAAGLTAAQVADDLDELERARFIVVDADAEELLIRSFIRRDKGYRQPNVLRAAAEHLKVVTSRTILRELAAELERIGSSGDCPPGAAGLLAEMRATIRKAVPADDEGSGKGTENPSRKGTANPTSGALGERGVSTTVTTDSPFPVPRIPHPQPSAGGRADAPAREADAPPEPPSDRCRKHQDTDDDPGPCGGCGDARKRRARWDRRQATTAAARQSRIARDRAAATAAAIAACGLCNDRGYANDKLCTHDPSQDQRVRQGAAAARAALATREVS
jgi:hypothetical protein